MPLFPVLPDEPPRAALARFAFEPTFTLGADVRVPVADRVRIGGGLAVPLFGRPLGARMSLDADVSLQWKHLSVLGGGGVWLSHGADASARATALGVELGGRGGYLHKRGSLGVELRVRPGLAAHLAPRDVTVDAWPDATAGWSAFPGIRATAGPYAVFWFGDAGFVGASGGWAGYPGGFADVGALPFHVDLHGGVRW